MRLLKRKVYITFLCDFDNEECFIARYVEFYFWNSRSEVIADTLKDFYNEYKPKIIRDLKIF